MCDWLCSTEFKQEVFSLSASLINILNVQVGTGPRCHVTVCFVPRSISHGLKAKGFCSYFKQVK